LRSALTSYVAVRFARVRSCATATSNSPSRAARANEIEHCSATVDSLRELHAYAKAVSASVKTNPPCAIA
jgi:hypothetical protein